MPELGKKVLRVGRQLLAWVGLVVLFRASVVWDEWLGSVGRLR